MNIRSLTVSIIASSAIALLCATPAKAGQTQNPPVPKPAEAKPDAKVPAVTVAGLVGKWNVKVEAQSGPIESTLDVKADPKDEKKFTGSIVSQMGEATLQGNVVDGKISFTFTMNANGNDMNVAFTGTQQKDGSLAGTLNFGQGDVTWTAVRAK